MKRILLTLIITLSACTIQAQDLGDIGNLGGDVNGLLNIPAPRGSAPPANRNAAPSRGGQPSAPPADRLARLREMLTKANSPLSQEQEAALNVLINGEIPAMRESLRARLIELQKVAGQPNPDELVPELNRLNDQLVAKIAAVPLLNPDQQSIIKQALREQIRSHGGFEALNLVMEEAKVPFSPEQASQIRALFDQQTQTRNQMLRGLQGKPPDPATLAQIETETLRNVLRLLNAAQRTALNSAQRK